MGALDGAVPLRPPDGGRPLTVLVPGGTGFIGRHVVSALLERGHRVVVGTRHPARRRRSHRLPAHDALAYRELHLDRLLDTDDWDRALIDCDAVINCVGILRERGHETYDRVHHRAPAALAAACARRDLRLIHISALGLETGAHSRFLTSKREGEAALRASRADWHIVRPSLLDGEGGFGARWIRRVARWPLHPIPRGARGRIAMLDVRDLGEAIAHLVVDAAPDGREHDLGGPHTRTLRGHLAAIRALHARRPAWVVPIPDVIARVVAHVCDLLHVTPFSFGHWELLQRDNRPLHNRLPALLGRAPRTVGAAETDDDTAAAAETISIPPRVLS